MVMAAGSSQFPQKFGRYFLLQKIAMGGMAEIFRAKSIGAEGFEKDIVIKRILPHFTEDESFVSMFKDEARVAAKLAHANIVQVFDFDSVDDLFYIAMEWIEGKDLKRVLDTGAKQGKPLSIAQSVFIITETAKGLHYAHAREEKGVSLGIVHRDISPHNVMVSYEGETKLMDFGIAKAASRSTKTRAGTVKGKCAYMSPEQARGKQLDGRSDLFALGVVLWEMLTGKRLFVGETDFETLNNVLKAEVPPAHELNPEVPESLDRIVLKALARDRDERQATVGEFIKELNQWFYSSVPDIDAVNLKAYMHDLFADDIRKLRDEITNSDNQLAEVRRGSTGQGPKADSNVALRSPDYEGGPPPDGATLALPIDDDPPRTMPMQAPPGAAAALAKALAGGGESEEATRALPEAGGGPAPGPRARPITGSSPAARAVGSGTGRSKGAADEYGELPKKGGGKGVAIGIGALVVAAALGAGAFFYTQQHEEIANPSSTAPGDKATAHDGDKASAKDGEKGPDKATTPDGEKKAVETFVNIKLKAPKPDMEIRVNGKSLGKGAGDFGGAVGQEVFVELVGADGKTLPAQKIKIEKEGQTIALSEPAPEAPKAAQADPNAPVVIVEVTPPDATLEINGKPAPLENGRFRVTGAKVGDTVKAIAQKDGHAKKEESFAVKSTLETFRIKLDRPKAEASSSGAKKEKKEDKDAGGVGKVKLNATPWAKVSWKGSSLGITPIQKDVPSGSQTFTFEKGDVRKSITVTVPKGGTVSRTVEMN